MIQQQSNQQVNIVARLIASQQELTAVEKFAQRHQAITTPANESLYSDLIPLSLPDAGEQYSFEIDLDACSGCKACVAACHSLNGLEEGEIWRNVGLLSGGNDENPVIQHVTSACHHCLEPGCMSGCPVRAYEKDPVTGIVEHLDDQCIGCKYCMFTCPYDVPSYSKSKGIVRKCNMCVDRLRVGEAPACVQACPNQAIKIRNVSVEEVVVKSTGTTLLPGSPDSDLTKPSSRYLSATPVASKGLPVDFHKAKSQHAHLPLVFMLVLTQMAFGIFAMGMLIGVTGKAVGNFFVWQTAVGFATLCAGLGLAMLHLGRPTKAYRAMSGFRTSWLSREIIGFNLFASVAASLFCSCFILKTWAVPLSIATVFFGILAVECSVMLYVVTGRPFWGSSRTHSLFFLSAFVTGAAATLLILGSSNPEFQMFAAGVLLVATTLKLVVESKVLFALKDTESTPEKLAASLIVVEQKNPALVRIALALVGGIVIPLLVFGGVNSMAVCALCLGCVLAGELLERYLFFAVCVARRMPGAPN